MATQDASQNPWKQKYLAQLDEQERAEKTWANERHLLQRLLVRTSLAADGQMPALDDLLARIRSLSKDDHVDLFSLRDMQERLDRVVVTLDEDRGQRIRQIQESFHQLLRPLNDKATERHQRKRIKTLDKQVGELAPSLPSLQALLSELSQLQTALLATTAAPPRERRSLFSRFLGGSDDSSTSAPANSAAGAVDEADTTLGDADDANDANANGATASQSASQAAGRLIEVLASMEDTELDTGEDPDEGELLRFAHRIHHLVAQLLEQVTLPTATETQARQLQASLTASKDWEELRAALDEIANLVVAAVGRGQREFEEFLQLLDQRLQSIQAHFDAQKSATEGRRSAAQDLNRSLSERLQAMGIEVDRAKDVVALKMSVQLHVEQIQAALQHFTDEEFSNEKLLEDQVSALQEKLAAFEVRTEQMRKQLQEERARALTDVLTQLPNREGWQERFALEYQRWQRYGQPISLAVVDIDLFKRINDTYGHLAGDKVIQLIAKALRDRLRATDFIARFGGEEFVILMPETNLEVALKVIDKLRDQIAQLPFHFRKERVTITVSAGVAGFTGTLDQDALFEAADRALYRAKAGGRNRVETTDSEPPA